MLANSLPGLQPEEVPGLLLLIGVSCISISILIRGPRGR